jgi:hypothetical protein
MTENISPSPFPLASREREIKNGFLRLFSQGELLTGMT